MLGFSRLGRLGYRLQRPLGRPQLRQGLPLALRSLSDWVSDWATETTAADEVVVERSSPPHPAGDYVQVVVEGLGQEMMQAAHSGQLSIATDLVAKMDSAHGSDGVVCLVNHKLEDGGFTPVFVAAQEGHPLLVRLLADCGAGMMPLFCVCFGGL